MSYHLVLNLGGNEWQTAFLKSYLKDEAKGNRVKIINLNPNDLHKSPNENEKLLFSKLNELSQIHIIDHGTPNSPSISSGHYTEVANYLAKRINKSSIKTSKEKLKIDLITCNSATGKQKGFAGLFHRYLGQVHHLDTEVISRTNVSMLNEKSITRGVLTDSLLHYTLTKIAHELKVPQSLLKFDPEKHHEQPGSTVKFKWLNNGHEAMVDFYIDTFAEKAGRLKDRVLSLSKKDQHISRLLDSIQNDLDEIIEISSKPELLTLKTVDSICARLDNIKKLVQTSKITPESKKKIQHSIDEVLSLRKKSITSDSIPAEHFSSMLNQDKPDLEDPIVSIKSELLGPCMTELRRIPENEGSAKLYQATHKFLTFTCNACAIRMKNNLSTDREREILKYVQEILNLVNDRHLTTQEKLKDIHFLTNDIQKLIKDEVLLTSAIKGGLEGFKLASSFGGLTTLKFLFPAIDGWSKTEKVAFPKYFKHIDLFIQEVTAFLIETNYAGFTPGTPHEKIREEAAFHVNRITMPIKSLYKELYSGLIYLQTAEKIDPRAIPIARIRLKEAKELLAETTKEMNKIYKAVENSPDSMVKDIYLGRCIPFIVVDLQDLESLIEQLTVILSHLE